jgi:hypothetical protein
LACHLQINADPELVPDSAYHFDVDPNADPNADPDFYLMQMQIRGTKMLWIHADPDADPHH